MKQEKLGLWQKSCMVELKHFYVHITEKLHLRETDSLLNFGNAFS